MHVVSKNKNGEKYDVERKFVSKVKVIVVEGYSSLMIVKGKAIYLILCVYKELEIVSGLRNRDLYTLVTCCTRVLCVVINAITKESNVVV